MKIASLTVILTSECNLRCGYCYQDGKNSRAMEWSTLQKALDLVLLAEEADPIVVFTGGEPLLCFPLMQMAVRHIAEQRLTNKAVRYGLSTNGVLVDEEIAAFLDENNVETRISFDGVPEAQNLRAAGTFERLDRLLDFLCNEHRAFLNNRVRINMSLAPKAIRFLADSVQYFFRKGVGELSIYPAITRQQEWSTAYLDELQSQFRRIFEISADRFRQTGNVPLLLFRKSPAEFLHSAGTRPVCGAVRGGSITVDVDGVAYRCVRAAESYMRSPRRIWGACGDPSRFGDIAAPDLRVTELRADEALVREDAGYSSYGRCAECRFIDSCMICPFLSGLDEPDTNRVPDFLCAFTKITTQYRALFPARPTTLEFLLSGLSGNMSNGGMGVGPKQT